MISDDTFPKTNKAIFYWKLENSNTKLWIADLYDKCATVSERNTLYNKLVCWINFLIDNKPDLIRSRLRENGLSVLVYVSDIPILILANDVSRNNIHLFRKLVRSPFLTGGNNGAS